ncbi:uncharacterized protein [Watersipora subatra]|uniref:uncharacterized protein n=1 Tax=Watersipora subatra TaxID=2589382 RepID=UPI00355B0E61
MGNTLSDSHMTIDLCIGYCTSLGHNYAGLQGADKCFCGENYDKHGEKDEHFCNLPCDSDSEQSCDGNNAISVYQTFPDGEAIQLEDEVDWTDDLMITNTISSELEVEIVSMIEHPLSTNKLLVATRDRLIEFTENGDCTVMAGIEVDQCDNLLDSAVHTFLRISDVTHVNFERIGQSSATFAVADTLDNCVKMFVITTNTFMKLLEFGTCNDEGIMGSMEKFAMNDIKLNEPKMVTTAYYDNLVQLIINCRLEDPYMVIASFYATESFGFAYFPNTNVMPIVMTAPYGSMRLEKKAQDCVVRWYRDAGEQSYDYACPSARVGFFQPHQINGTLIIVSKDATQVAKANQGMRNLQLEMCGDIPNVALLTGSKIGPGGFWIYNKFTRLFCFFEPSKKSTSQQVPKLSFHQVSESHECDGDLIEATQMESLEMCAYLCVKRKYSAFSFNINEAYCSLYVARTSQLGFHKLGSVCYRLETGN